MRQFKPLFAQAEQYVSKYGDDAWKYSLQAAQREDLQQGLTSAIVYVWLRKIFISLGDGVNDYRNFFEHPKVHRFYQEFARQLIGLMGMTEDVVTSEMSTQLATTWHECMHEKYGTRVYEVSDGLADRLLRTELRGLKTDDLRLPYPSIYVTVPFSTKLRVWNYKTEWHPVEGVYLAEAQDNDYGRVWRFMVIGPSKNPENEFDDALFYFTVPLVPGKSVDEALETEHKRVFEKYQSREVIKAYSDDWLMMFRWAMNVTVYATYTDARREEYFGNPEAAKLQEQLKKHPKGSNKYERARERWRAIEPMRRIVLGKGIQPLTGEPAEPGKPLTVRVLVQGHWRNQPHGPQRSLRKLIWIEPFWRGPETGEEAYSRHVLQ